MQGYQRDGSNEAVPIWRRQLHRKGSRAHEGNIGKGGGGRVLRKEKLRDVGRNSGTKTRRVGKRKGLKRLQLSGEPGGRAAVSEKSKKKRWLSEDKFRPIRQSAHERKRQAAPGPTRQGSAPNRASPLHQGEQRSGRKPLEGS